MAKRGQVTIFILIAIAIVAVILVVFYPQIRVYFAPSEPITYVEECVKGEVANAISKIGLQGGSMTPSFYLAYQGNSVEYLCYTNLYYKTCVMQQPMLLQHVEREIQDFIGDKARTCIDNLKTEMEARGYTVASTYQGTDVQVAPTGIIITVNAKVSLTKEGTQSFSKFEFNQQSNMYNLIMLSNSVLNYEARYGDSEITTFMFYYPNIRVEKIKQGDGSKIYSLTDIGTNEKFMFATRSMAWPGGYKLTL